VQGYSLTCDAAVYDTTPLLLSSYSQQPQLNTACPSSSPVHDSKSALHTNLKNLSNVQHLR
jgi:hypothetical protein